MALGTAYSEKSNNGTGKLLVRPGKPTQRGEPTLEYGWLDMAHLPKYFAGHSADVWGRLFAADHEGDLIAITLVKWLEKYSNDFVSIEHGLETFHAWLGKYLAERNPPSPTGTAA